MQLGPVVVNGVDRASADGDLAIRRRRPTPAGRGRRRRSATPDGPCADREIERLSDALAIDQIHLPHVVTAGITRDDVARLAAGL